MGSLLHVLVNGNLVTGLECTVIWLCVSVQCCGTSDLRLCGRSRWGTVWEGWSSWCGVCWWRGVVESHVVESVGGCWCWDRSLCLYGCWVAASRATEGGFCGESAHDCVIDIVADGSMFGEAFEFLYEVISICFATKSSCNQPAIPQLLFSFHETSRMSRRTFLIFLNERLLLIIFCLCSGSILRGKNLFS